MLRQAKQVKKGFSNKLQLLQNLRTNTQLHITLYKSNLQ